mmetsp:Transcript_44106/g.122678  ORF Transcript_44106/g.122678 Transcript_44106/m.122678 type:complete len:221 (-) Transcript_44106:643-1305(-)
MAWNEMPSTKRSGRRSLAARCCTACSASLLAARAASKSVASSLLSLPVSPFPAAAAPPTPPSVATAAAAAATDACGAGTHSSCLHGCCCHARWYAQGTGCSCRPQNCHAVELATLGSRTGRSRTGVVRKARSACTALVLRGCMQGSIQRVVWRCKLRDLLVSTTVQHCSWPSGCCRCHLWNSNGLLNARLSARCELLGIRRHCRFRCTRSNMNVCLTTAG